MVDLSGGQDGPLEHAFSNSVFIVPGIVVVSLTDIILYIKHYFGVEKYQKEQEIFNYWDQYFKMEGEVPLPDLNLGNLIKERVADSLKNVDVLSLLKQMVGSVSDNAESEDVRQKLESILTQYNLLPEEQKVQFVQQVKAALATKLATKLQETPLDTSELEDAIKGAVMSQIYLFGAGALIVVLLLVFFGYKLFKSIKDKEKKKEEKKKLKQMKKKK